MKHMTKMIAVIAVLVMALCCFAGCAKKTDVEKIKDAGKITMLTEPGFAPFEYIDAEGNVAGVDVEISKKVAEKLGVELEVVSMNFDAIITAVQSGKGDLAAAGITATEERAEMVAFSTNYVDTGIHIIVNEGSAIASPEDIVAGVNVGVQTGTTSDIFASGIEGVEVGGYTTLADAVVALQAGKVDAVIADELPAQEAVANNPGLVYIEEALSVEQYAIGVAKENTELLAVVNEVVGEMIESGEMDQLITEHMELAKAVG